MGTVGGWCVGALACFYGLLAIVLVVLFLIEIPIVGVGAGSFRHRMDEAMRLVRRYVGLNGLVGAITPTINLVIMLLVGTDAGVVGGHRSCSPCPLRLPDSVILLPSDAAGVRHRARHGAVRGLLHGQLHRR
jgi:hypothetical protein